MPDRRPGQGARYQGQKGFVSFEPPRAASGRIIANGRDEGFTKLLFDDSPEVRGHGRILSGGVVGAMINEINLAIEMGAALSILARSSIRITRREKAAAWVACGICSHVPEAWK